MIPTIRKKKLKMWKALVVWSDNETRLNDISLYFNMESKKQAYQASWITNIMASQVVWEFYCKRSKVRVNVKDNNPKWEVNMVGVAQPKFLLLLLFTMFFLNNT